MYRPPFENVQNASKEELPKIIRSLKIRLYKLKRIMEHPFYESTVCPDELTIYKCDKKLLSEAIVRYTVLGGEYKPSRCELRDIKGYKRGINQSIYMDKQKRLIRAFFI